MKLRKTVFALVAGTAALSTSVVTMQATAGGSEQSVLKNAIVMITNWGDDTVSVVDLDSGTQLAEIKVGAKPYDVKLDTAGRMAYVSNSAASDLSVIDVQ